MRNVLNELRQTARTLAASRGFTVAVLATLAAAVALETTTLSVVNAYLLRSLPYPAAERLYRIAYAAPGEREPRDLERVDWQSLSDVVEERIAWDLDVFYLMGDEYPERVAGQWVTPGFMRGFGVAPAIGRAFREEDFVPGAAPVAMIDDELWHRRFGGDSSVLGRTFRAYVSDRPRDAEVFTIVGVLPPTFWHVNPYTRVLTPLRAATYPYLLRLREGVEPAQVQARVDALVRQADGGLPASWHTQLESVHAAYTKSMRPLLAAVTAAVTLVLIIACANVTLLMVLRGMKRRAEIAVRVALGASSRQIARLLAGESLVLCGASAAAGTAIALVMLQSMGPMIERQLGRNVPGGSRALVVDGHVALAVVLLTVLMTLATSVPTMLVTRTGGILRSMGTRSSDGPGAARARSLLISLQLAGCFGLLAGCGLMVRTVRNMVGVPTGMTVEGVVEAGVATRERSYASDTARIAFHEHVLTLLAASPGVRAAALSSPSPLASYQPRRIAVDGEPARIARAAVRSVSAQYFTLLGVPLKDGRAFTSDDRLDAERTAIISESLARSLWPMSRAVGRSLTGYEPRATGDDSVLVVRRVVGVVGDVRQSATDSLVADVYVPLSQSPTRFAVMLAAPATHGSPVDWSSTLRRVVRSVDPEATVGQPTPLSASVDDQTRRPRFLASIFAAFGIFSFAIGVLGVYGVTAYSVRQRDREIAVRIAVGADRRHVVGLFLRQAGAQVIVGLVFGVLAAGTIGRLLAAQLFGIATVEPGTVGVVGALLSIASAVAVAWPAWRAAGANPTTSLRAP